MRMTSALLLAALIAAPGIGFAGDTTSTGITGLTNTVVVTVGGTTRGGTPVGACTPTPTSSC